MIDLYTWTTPNGHKVSIALEEMGLEHSIHPVNIGEGEQFSEHFQSISPNGRIPAIVDRDTDITVFESGAILVYLAEKSGKFLPESGPARAKVMEWLFWQMAGFGPMLGQLNHFVNTADEQVPYAIKRYSDEVARLYDVLDKRLDEAEYVGGDYSIADMSIYPWSAVAYDLIKGLTGKTLANVERWQSAIAARPAVQKGILVPVL